MCAIYQYVEDMLTIIRPHDGKGIASYLAYLLSFVHHASICFHLIVLGSIHRLQVHIQEMTAWCSQQCLRQNVLELLSLAFNQSAVLILHQVILGIIVKTDYWCFRSFGHHGVWKTCICSKY